MKPVVRLTASATRALPRWLLLTLCFVYAAFGLFGRDPWKNEDAAGFGVMWTMAKGGWHDWLLPKQQNSGNFLRQISSRNRDFVFHGENVFSISNTLL